MEKNITFKDKLADKMSEIFGSWTFICLFALFIILWILFNIYILYYKGNTIDPYPFILLNLFLSCVAAIQAPIIMMSQNRQAKKDILRNKNDYHVDLKSELILEILHEQMAKIQKEIFEYLKDPDREIKLYTQDDLDEYVQKRVQKELKRLLKEEEKTIE